MSGTSGIPEAVWTLAYECVGATNVYVDRDASLHMIERISRLLLNQRERIADACLAKRYTEDQGIDAEMEAYNGGLEDAAKIARGEA